jgi:hypothetical protein
MKQEKEGLSVLGSPDHLIIGTKAHVSKQTGFRNISNHSQLPSSNSFLPVLTNPPHPEKKKPKTLNSLLKLQK